ncbi:uncharacterized protein A1O9_00742 [Exophiala aquamarina CBS 119918]|uniref:HMG box domain-containing protein n=1 Tax=Exophiala aquamarina CBS 119918 TaxID=1182545 RepID=A0A072PRU0_9EURO|nr:uncharacterized protein A1O9_00742 [Exophiala aquamarina CBS 119918]KEF62769.1 hypothetical protein A1O9_00742 [Exophiala aquamarina CBS 119918]
MTDIAPYLERLGLEQYFDAFIGEGFDTWETVLDIQETDFDALNVKLGHRRKLQRAIADHRGISYERLIGSPAQESLYEGGKNVEAGIPPLATTERGSGPVPETKRKYRRHPKPDENAPERPPSAYVIFSNKVREEVKDQSLSFTQIAKLVGDRWQKLDPPGKEPFEAQANAAKERYNIQLSTYRKTDSYKEYMQYLSEFKAKHGQPTEQKRPRLEPESSGSIVSARSMELNQEAVSNHSTHVRGGSIGSLASSPYTGGPAHSTSSLPLGAAPSRPPMPSSRSGSPPALQPTRESYRPGLISSHSSVSDESSTMRSDLPESLLRTAGLSLGSASGTPPLPSQTSSAGPFDPVGSPDMLTRSRLPFFTQTPIQNVPPASGPGQMPGQLPPHLPLSSPSFPLPYPSPTAQEAAWRSRAHDPRGLYDSPRVLQPSTPFAPGGHQIGPSHLPPLLTPDKTHDPSQPHGMRNLPPPRAPPQGPSVLPFIGRPLDHSRPLAGEAHFERPQPQEEARKRLESPENDAANTLAGLATVASRPNTTAPSNHLPPR